MEKGRILIARNSKGINGLKRLLEFECKLANDALLDIIDAGALCVDVTDEIAREIAQRNPDTLVEAVRSQLEKESSSKIGIARRAQVDALMRTVKDNFKSIFGKYEAKESHDSLWWRCQYGKDSEMDWVKYIRFDGERITYDANALEADHCTYIGPGSVQYDYLAKAEQLCKQISEFIVLTQKLGHHRVIASEGDCSALIIISRDKDVFLDTKKIDWLDFGGYDDALAAAGQATFKREPTNY